MAKFHAVGSIFFLQDRQVFQPLIPEYNPPSQKTITDKLVSKENDQIILNMLTDQ